MNRPTTISEVVEVVRATPRLRPRGGNTKPRLAKPEDDQEILDMRGLSGVIEYQPSEYTFSAWAGTPIQELNETLAAKGQYIPFDPLWSQAGSTLGGTVAANAAGPGRIRYGSVRDFVIGMNIIDGLGRSIQGGGKVVKNAAGFDLPKLFTGSLGRWGIMTEITCKVFPRPESTITRQWAFDRHEDAVRKMLALAKSSLEPDALEYDPAERALFMRASGPEAALSGLARRIGGQTGPDSLWWNELGQCGWSPAENALIRISISPLQVTAVVDDLNGDSGNRCWVSGGGNSLWVSTTDMAVVERILLKHQLAGLVYSDGNEDSVPLWLGALPDRKIDAALKAVFDPEYRFGDTR